MNTTTNLAERAMLVSLKIRRWQATRTDKKVSAEIAATHGVSERRAGHYRKHAIDVNAASFKAVVSAGSELRNKHYELTLPWGQDGARILTTEMFETYSNEMRHLKATFERVVREFVSDYPVLKAAAKRELNGMYNEGDYPTDIAARFEAGWSVMPLPEAEDFRAHLSRDTVAEIRKEIEVELERTTAEAMRDPFNRIHDHVSRMVERLSKDDAVFRDTLVTGLADLCAILPGLNLTNDAKLDDLRKRCEKMIANLDPEDLRQVPSVRSRVAKQAKAIQKEVQKIQDGMAAFMGYAEEAA